MDYAYERCEASCRSDQELQDSAVDPSGMLVYFLGRLVRALWSSLKPIFLDKPAAAYRQTRERSNDDRSKWLGGRGELKAIAEGQVRCVETQVTEFSKVLQSVKRIGVCVGRRCQELLWSGN